MWLHQGMNILCKSQSPHLTVNIFTANSSNATAWLPQNLKVSHELNKHRVGLTLRHRGLGQLNRDMSLSNKAGKLQNGHLKKAREEGRVKEWRWEEMCDTAVHETQTTQTKQSHSEDTEGDYFPYEYRPPLYRLGSSLKCIKRHLSNIIKHYMDPGWFGQKLEYYCTGPSTSERRKCWLQS